MIRLGPSCFCFSGVSSWASVHNAVLGGRWLLCDSGKQLLCDSASGHYGFAWIHHQACYSLSLSKNCYFKSDKPKLPAFLELGGETSFEERGYNIIFFDKTKKTLKNNNQKSCKLCPFPITWTSLWYNSASKEFTVWSRLLICCLLSKGWIIIKRWGREFHGKMHMYKESQLLEWLESTVWKGSGEERMMGEMKLALEAQVRLCKVKWTKYFGLDPVGSGDQSTFLLVGTT